MSSISVEELEQKIEAGEEVIDKYFDTSSIRTGERKIMTGRRSKKVAEEVATAQIELPAQLVKTLDAVAQELNIDRQAVAVMMLQQALNQHQLAKLAATGGATLPAAAAPETASAESDPIDPKTDPKADSSSAAA